MKTPQQADTRLLEEQLNTRNIASERSVVKTTDGGCSINVVKLTFAETSLAC